MVTNVTITRVDNGFIVKSGDNHYVFTDKYDPLDEFNELPSLQEALLQVKEELGYFNSKHNKKNIVIEIKETKAYE